MPLRTFQMRRRRDRLLGSTSHRSRIGARRSNASRFNGRKDEPSQGIGAGAAGLPCSIDGSLCSLRLLFSMHRLRCSGSQRSQFAFNSRASHHNALLVGRLIVGRRALRDRLLVCRNCLQCRARGLWSSTPSTRRTHRLARTSLRSLAQLRSALACPRGSCDRT